jgi:cell division protein FtsB
MKAVGMVNALSVTRMQDEKTQAWHGEKEDSSSEGLMALVVAQHRANFDLWHEEDKARDPKASDAEIAAVKHAIDRLNQRRNDLVEEMDEKLLALAGEQNPNAPLHSETPGMMIDRLSILALKIYHTHEEATRETATETHRRKNAAKLAVLEEQRNDLARCLDELWEEVTERTRRFKLYRQMKMYNDPELNPVVYGRG